MHQLLRLLTDLGLNISLLLSFLLLYSWGRPLLCRVRKPLQQILIGALFGALTILAMQAPVLVAPGIFIDGRNVITALAGCFAGPVSAAVVGAMAIAYRLYLGGPGAWPGACAIAAAAAAGALVQVWRTRTHRPIDAWLLSLLGLFTAAGGLAATCLLPPTLVGPMLRAMAFPVLVGFPLASVLLGSLLLLEERRYEAEAKLAAEQKHLRAIIDNTTAIIYAKTPDGRYLLVNRAFGALFDVVPDRIIGRCDHDIIPPRVAAALRASDQEALAAGAPIEREETLYLEDGPHTYLSLKFPLYDDAGACYALCGISTDITERKRTEEERRQSLLRIQEALRLRETFLSVASHELRTPLTSLHLLLDSLVRSASREGGPPADPEVTRKKLVRAERQSSRLITLVNELLDLSRLGQEGIRLRLEATDLGEVVRDVLDRDRERIEAAGCAVVLEDRPNVVGSWDRLRLEQIVLNLLSNAAKFGARKPIEIRVAEEPDLAVLTVRDHGIGVADCDRERIFGKFERAVSQRNYGGLGLGLFIARELAEAHGGTLTVESEVDGGASFRLTLPRTARVERATAFHAFGFAVSHAWETASRSAPGGDL